jgi:hypothetical protein
MKKIFAALILSLFMVSWVWSGNGGCPYTKPLGCGGTVSGNYTATGEWDFEKTYYNENSTEVIHVITSVDSDKTPLTVDTIVQPGVGVAMIQGTHTGCTTTAATGFGDDNLTVTVVIDATPEITTVTVENSIGTADGYNVNDTITLDGLSACGGGGDDDGTVDIATINTNTFQDPVFGRTVIDGGDFTGNASPGVFGTYNTWFTGSDNNLSDLDISDIYGGTFIGLRINQTLGRDNDLTADGIYGIRAFPGLTDAILEASTHSIQAIGGINVKDWHSANTGLDRIDTLVNFWGIHMHTFTEGAKATNTYTLASENVGDASRIALGTSLEATLGWDGTEFDFNKKIDVTGGIDVDGDIELALNHFLNFTTGSIRGLANGMNIVAPAMVYSMEDESGTPVSPFGASKHWYFYVLLSNDADNICDTGTDCITIPDVNTSGMLRCIVIDVANGDSVFAIWSIDGAGVTAEVLAHAKAGTTLGTADSLNVYDCGTQACLINELGQSEAPQCDFVYN